ncbi:uncharacterized protein LOC142792746 [Rhipicephalus microplus]|uniref:uncharacterized protein LOC142792746 n=1 Tax=Rhipicephalus microplus TaxID=6941 RepID=UPI003F6C55BB
MAGCMVFSVQLHSGDFVSKFSTYTSPVGLVYALRSAPLRASNSSALPLELSYRGALLMISLLAHGIYFVFGSRDSEHATAASVTNETQRGVRGEGLRVKGQGATACPGGADRTHLLQCSRGSVFCPGWLGIAADSAALPEIVHLSRRCFCLAQGSNRKQPFLRGANHVRRPPTAGPKSFRLERPLSRQQQQQQQPHVKQHRAAPANQAQSDENSRRGRVVLALHTWMLHCRPRR